MGAVEDAVDAAAEFVGPFVARPGEKSDRAQDDFDAVKTLDEALSHMQAINKADLAADPDAPYDASLAGVVYGLLDLITSLGILPYLTHGVAFGHRPKSVLRAGSAISNQHDKTALSRVTRTFIGIQTQGTSGLQPLLSQRCLPDILSALAELAFAPDSCEVDRGQYILTFNTLVSSTPTSRMLPILTTFLQQPLPDWLKPVLSKELSTIPLRPKGIRHTIEFLSLSYLSKNSQVPQDASRSQSQLPIPLEAITQASRLLTLPPAGVSQEEWLTEIAPQLWSLIDGEDGIELSRAAGQIIAGGILSKKSTGAPGAAGWAIYAQPLIQSIYPSGIDASPAMTRVVTDESSLKKALKRLAVISASYSHAGLIRRLIGPILLPLWALLNYCKQKAALEKEWIRTTQNILKRYIDIACDAGQIDGVANNLFWEGDVGWTFGPGAHGGVEIRTQATTAPSQVDMQSIFARIESLDSRVQLLVSLLKASKVPDDTIGSIFLRTSRRWLAVDGSTKNSLLDDDEDPLTALTDAKLSQALAVNFNEQFARKPQHIIELMNQLLDNFVTEHKDKAKRQLRASQPSRTALNNIIPHSQAPTNMDDANDETIASFAISILSTLVSSPDFAQTPKTRTILASTIAPLVYLSEPNSILSIPQTLTNAAASLLHVLQPFPASQKDPTSDPLLGHRNTLQTVLKDLTSPDPPNRTWALTTLRNLIDDPSAFTVLDVPSITHMLLSASLADPESYVHTAAIPVLVDLATAAPNPVSSIIVDAFTDIDERSLRLRRGKATDEKSRELQEALDFRLRTGEVLSHLIGSDRFWANAGTSRLRFAKHLASACLTLASRRGQRKQTLLARTSVLDAERRIQEEGEAAWDGPIPNLLDPEGENAQDQADRDALLKIVQGWEDTGIEEDMRIRTSALSVLAGVLENRLELVKQVDVDAALQIVVLVLTVEGGEAKSILRRAAVLVVLGLLKGLETSLEGAAKVDIVFGGKQEEEMERVLRWIRDEDGDEIVRGHAESVVESMEALRLRRLYNVRDRGVGLGADLGLGGQLQGLDIEAGVNERRGTSGRIMVEEIE